MCCVVHVNKFLLAITYVTKKAVLMVPPHSFLRNLEQVRGEMTGIAINPRPTGGGAISSPPSGFLAISSKPMQVSPPNLQYPLSQQFYRLC